MRLPADLCVLAQRQRGLLSRGQVFAGGITSGQVRWAVGRSWRLVLPGVVSVFTGPLDEAQQIIAGQLYAGPEAMLASVNAVRWHAIGDLPTDGVVRFLAPGSHASRRHSFVVVRRTRRPDPHPWERPPLRVCSRPRALIDAAREMRSATAARDLLLPAAQQRHVREHDLWAELEAGPSRGSAPVRAALREVSTGAWSKPEVDMLTVLAASPRLPRIWPNPVLQAPDGTVLPTPDGWIDEVGLALQVQSRRYHLRDEHWEATIETGTIFGEYGVPVLGTTPKALADDPDRFVRRVEATFAHLRRSGHRPAVRMIPRGPGVVT